MNPILNDRQMRILAMVAQRSRTLRDFTHSQERRADLHVQSEDVQLAMLSDLRDMGYIVLRGDRYCILPAGRYVMQRQKDALAAPTVICNSTSREPLDLKHEWRGFVQRPGSDHSHLKSRGIG